MPPRPFSVTGWMVFAGEAPRGASHADMRPACGIGDDAIPARRHPATGGSRIVGRPRRGDAPTETKPGPSPIRTTTGGCPYGPRAAPQTTRDAYMCGTRPSARHLRKQHSRAHLPAFAAARKEAKKATFEPKRARLAIKRASFSGDSKRIEFKYIRANSKRIQDVFKRNKALLRTHKPLIYNKKHRRGRNFIEIRPNRANCLFAPICPPPLPDRLPSKTGGSRTVGRAREGVAPYDRGHPLLRSASAAGVVSDSATAPGFRSSPSRSDRPFSPGADSTFPGRGANLLLSGGREARVFIFPRECGRRALRLRIRKGRAASAALILQGECDSCEKWRV